MRHTWIGCAGRAAGLALVLLGLSAAHAGEAHRWVDSEGNVHYSDAPPPDSVRKPKVEEDEAAVRERETREAAEQKAADEADAARRRDHVLLQSYSTVEEIERTRDRRVEGVEGEIGLAEHRVERARERIEQYDDLLAELPADHENRAKLERQRGQVVERLERRRQELEQLREKRAELEARFERDIERFRELQAEDEAE